MGLLGPATLLLVRHAEVDNGGGRLFIGRTELRLTARGETQALAAASRLGGDAPCPVYTSPQARARRTADALQGTGFGPAVVVPGLREIDFGAWEGRPSDEVEAEHPGDFARWRAVDRAFAFPGGEALAAAAGRAREALEALWPEPGGIAVAVSHGGVLRLGILELLGLPWSAAPKLRLDFASLSRLERHGDRIVLAALNDTAHLSGLLEAAR